MKVLLHLVLILEQPINRLLMPQRLPDDIGRRLAVDVEEPDALNWYSFGKLSLPKRGDDDGKRQQLGEEGKEEAQEGRGAEVGPGKGKHSTQEAVMAARARRTMSTQGWSSKHRLGLTPRAVGANPTPCASSASPPPAILSYPATSALRRELVDE